MLERRQHSTSATPQRSASAQHYGAIPKTLDQLKILWDYLTKFVPISKN